MPLTPGTRLGPYEILAALGAGGMGEVYRARDTKLKRDVAVKVLPDLVASDPDRLARFHREAEVLAALNHPNIAHIYGVEDSSRTHALVMELVEGPTLADRIAHGPIPLNEALPIAKQIAEALEAAHDQGIVHRDLKPANIKVRDDGTVKVLDFGLAKLVETSAATPSSNPDVTASPTITTPAMMTAVGVILGTAAYMSPEQAKGRPADKRSDVWAFGCVLYEMVSGRRAFDGEDLSTTLAAVLRDEPAWNALPDNTPSEVVAIVKGCLEKDRRHRIGDIAVAVFMLREPNTFRRGSARPLTSAAGIAGAVLASIVLTAATMSWSLSRPTATNLTRLMITPAGPTALTITGQSRDIAISPDGTRVIYIGGSANGELLVRPLNSLASTRLTDARAPRNPFVSPDNKWVGFSDGTTIKKVAATGGPSVIVCRCLNAAIRGATWGGDESIVFVPSPTGSSGLWRVAAVGGEATPVATPKPERGELGYIWPEFVPGRQAVLFTILKTTGGLEKADIAVADLHTGAVTVLMQGGSDAHYVSTGHLVYGAAGTLLAIPFDVARLTAHGTPTPVIPEVLMDANGMTDFDLAADGTLIYVPSTGQLVRRTLLWVDRQGHEEAIPAPERAYLYPRISPDGERIALDVRDQDQDVWIWDSIRKTLSRFTFDPTPDRFPLWTPGGRSLIFSSSRTGPASLFRQLLAGGPGAEQLTTAAVNQSPTSIAPDGSSLIYMENNIVMRIDLRTSRSSPERLFDGRNGEISPDGHWIAYETNESGQYEVLVRPFPNVTSGRWQVSVGGGSQPLWARSGRELFYRTPSGAVMAMQVENGSSWNTTSPTKVLDGPYMMAGAGTTGRQYDVSPDGRKFLMIKPISGADSAYQGSVVVVQHFDEELKRLVPAK